MERIESCSCPWSPASITLWQPDSTCVSESSQDQQSAQPTIPDARAVNADELNAAGGFLVDLFHSACCAKRYLTVCDVGEEQALGTG